MMVWTHDDLLSLTPEEFEYVIGQLLQRMGFRDVQVIGGPYDKGIDIMAFKDDPIAGSELYVVQIKRKTSGKIGYTELERFVRAIKKASAARGIFITSTDFTRDAYRFAREEHSGRLILWNYLKVLENLNKYDIPKPLRDTLQKPHHSQESPKQSKEKLPKLRLKNFTVGYPLLFDFDPYEFIEIGRKNLSKKYRLSKEKIHARSVVLGLSAGYIIDWKVYYEGFDSAGRRRTLTEEDRALVFHDGRIILYGTENPKLKIAMNTAMRKSSGSFEASDREILRGITMSEAVTLVKSNITYRYHGTINITIPNKKKVYIPLWAIVEYKLNKNIARAKFDAMRKEIVHIEIDPLSKSELKEIAILECRKKLGEELINAIVEYGRGTAMVKGETLRFTCFVEIDSMTGEVVFVDTQMKDSAVEELLRSLYPNGRIFSIEKRKDEIIADILNNDSVEIVSVNLKDGSHAVLRSLIDPRTAGILARKWVMSEYLLNNLEIDNIELIKHQSWKVTLSGIEGQAIVEVSGDGKRLLPIKITISENKARKLLENIYQNFKIDCIKWIENGYYAKLEDEKYTVEIELSSDGKKIHQIDKYVNKDFACKIAKSWVTKNYPMDDIEVTSAKLTKNKEWEISLEGRDGKIKVIVGKDGKKVDSIDIKVSKDRALKIIKEAYPHFNIIMLEWVGSFYRAKVEGKKSIITVELSSDGLTLIKRDEVLKKDTVIVAAIEYLKNKGIEVEKIEAELKKDWEISFEGPVYWGTLKIAKAREEVIEEDIRYTKDYLIKLFLKHIGDSTAKIVKVNYYEDKGYVNVKATNEESKTLYYGKIDIKSAQIIESDILIDKGITAKLKKAKLEMKYH